MSPRLIANTWLICFIAELGMIAVPALARDLDGRYTIAQDPDRFTAIRSDPPARSVLRRMLRRPTTTSLHTSAEHKRWRTSL